MVTLLVGKKGSGKTKKLIESANEAVRVSNGNVVVIEKGLKLTYDISHRARLVDTGAYGVQGPEMLFGFLSGICAGNYDVTDMFIDSTLKIIGDDMETLAAFIEKANKLAGQAEVRLTFSVSADASAIPESLNGIVDKV